MSCVGHCVLLKLRRTAKCLEEIKRMIRGLKKFEGKVEEHRHHCETTVGYLWMFVVIEGGP